MQGATFNFADELAGGVEGVRSLIGGEGFGSGYDRGVAESRARNKFVAEQHPGTYLAGELTGGLGSAVATPMLTPFRAGLMVPWPVRAAAKATLSTACPRPCPGRVLARF